MATGQPQQTDHRSSGLSLNLSSNNPFRNRTVSPSQQSLASPFDDPPARPVSRNPFLDPTLAAKPSTQNLISIDEPKEEMSTTEKSSSPTAEDIFASLTLDEKKSPPPGQAKTGAPRPPPPGARRGPPPPGARRGPPPPNHRPSRSQEEALRARKLQAEANGKETNGKSPFDSSRSPPRRGERRPRRNSESSTMDPEKDRTLTEDERKAREARRRERERKHREIKDKKPVNRKLDIIDQLDATSIYGTGLFHHDGPYDALNTHRNRRGSNRAPMQAFPKDSLNNILGGGGPLNARPNHATFMGQHDEEAYLEWSSGAGPKGDGVDCLPKAKDATAVWDPMSRGSILHGDESLGLGTSTFLEGTPAARTVIQKREEERAAEVQTDGLSRKKSLAQRIRSINRGPRDFQGSGRLTGPEGGYSSRRSPSGHVTSGSLSTPGGTERNPFFNEFEKGGEDMIAVRRTDSENAPEPRLERRATSDSTVAEEQQPKQPSGLLARVKSLKGGKRTRPAPPPPIGSAMPPSLASPGAAI